MLIDCRFQLQMGQFHIEPSFQSDASVIGLFGASGSGKTSILHAIAGLNTPRSGLIKIQDQTWFDSDQKINVSTQKRHVGLVFQDAQLFRIKQSSKIYYLVLSIFPNKNVTSKQITLLSY